MKTEHSEHFASIDRVAQSFAAVDYIASPAIATSVYLGFHLEKPILIEGPAGVGKTELAKSMAEILDVPLIRMQCYEGLDESKALYEWKYGKQLLYTQLLKDKLGEMMQGARGLAESMDRLHAHDDLFFSEHFLEPRPLYQALHQEKGCVLLIDEIDKSDQEFEAFLLEVLSDFQVSIPELGTRTAVRIPFVLLTSNNYRDMSDALKRRCVHLYIDYPARDTEISIVRLKIPDIEERLCAVLVDSIRKIRTLDLKKSPSISETLDWAQSLLALQITELTPEVISETLNVICKYQADLEKVRKNIDRVVAGDFDPAPYTRLNCLSSSSRVKTRAVGRP